MNKLAVLLAPAAAAVCLGAVVTPEAHAAPGSTTTYEATLNPLNGSGASGTLWVSLTGNRAVITEQTAGLAAMFMGTPYPHVQHIHGGAMGVCPSPSADINHDGVISTSEGAPSYGGIESTLSVSGDTSPAAGTNLALAPVGASFSYSRTITLDPATIASLQEDTAVVVVHGLDPATLSPRAQDEPSDLVPFLPLAATSPALCGKLVKAQMAQMPAGGVQTGGGGMAGVQDAGLFYTSGALALGAAGAFVGRRRFATKH